MVEADNTPVTGAKSKQVAGNTFCGNSLSLLSLIWIATQRDIRQYCHTTREYWELDSKASWSSVVRDQPAEPKLPQSKGDLRSASETIRSVDQLQHRDLSGLRSDIRSIAEEEDSEELATFLAFESETQKEMHKDDSVDFDHIKVHENLENPYYIQNMVNVMNNQKVYRSSEKQSLERSLDKRTSDLARTSVYSSCKKSISRPRHNAVEKTKLGVDMSRSGSETKALNESRKKAATSVAYYTKHKPGNTGNIMNANRSVEKKMDFDAKQSIESSSSKNLATSIKFHTNKNSPSKYEYIVLIF